ncbi:MAG: TIGR02147 family protein [Deltaproteobacteria bacterium]|nr:MAG: TIGR02147 family protein [Deltaproteobacteria bacterium]
MPLMSLPHENTLERPDIRQYSDYRSYLRDIIPYLKVADPEFSYRTFSRRAGFSSPNYLKLVAESQRNLAPASIDKFARGLGLDRRERRVFRLLVLLDGARTDRERNDHYMGLLELVTDDPNARLRSHQFEVYRDWYPLVIREMTALSDFRPDPQWVSQRLRPRITTAQARRALKQLFELGLMVHSEDGSVEPAERRISTGPEVHSLAVRNYHRAHLGLAAEALDGVEQADRNVTSVTVKLSKSGYDEAVREIAKLREKLLDLADEPQIDDDDAEIHHIVVALFPVTQPGRRSGDAS